MGRDAAAFGAGELRLGRRLLVSFVLSAVLPISLAFAFAYAHVSDQLRDQSERRLRLASRAVGLELLDRIQAVDRALGRFAHRGTLPPPEVPIAAISTLDPSGAVVGRLGEMDDAPPLGAEDLHSLERSGRLLRVVGHEPHRIELLRAAPEDGSEAIWIARLDGARLFNVADHSGLPHDADVRVFRGSVALAGPPGVSLPAGSPERGFFRFGHGGEEQFGHVYPLFLQAQFQSPPWNVILSERRERVMAPVHGFRRIFPLAGLLSLILVAWISIRQIRARLEPLQALQSGALRIAERDFDVRIRLDSGDELEDLADSFNDMAERLQHQFDALSTLIEIDRDILAATDTEALVEALARDLPRICPCDAILMARLDDDGASPAAVVASVGALDAPQRVEAPQGLPVDHRQRLARGEIVGIDLGEDDAPYLAPLRELGAPNVRVLPLVLRSRLMGVVALAWREAPARGVEEDLVYARRVADQGAVALDSVHVHEENRTLAYFDPLTELPNRLLFQERLEQALERARRSGSQVAVCLLDLDGFKHINDALGHGAGDRVLRLVALRAQQFLRAGSFARLGGDEFALLFSELGEPQGVARAVERLLALVARPFELDGGEVTLTASVGIAVSPGDGIDPETLVKHAEVAMYHVKEEGRNHFQFFSEAMTVSAMARMRLEQALRYALENEEMHLAYQPILSAEDGRIVAAEALMRWRHAEDGPIPPGEFIPIAEEAGLIGKLGDWALEEASQQARRWEERGLPIAVSVNVSPRQFRDESLVSKVRSAAARAGIDCDRIILEITETVLMENEEWAVAKLLELKALGVQIAIDDFGTGYSSFAYLRQFPVDTLKLDRQFVRDLDTSPTAGEVARAMIHLGHSLGMNVVAEGVETEGQERFLVEAGCDRLQGFRFARPGPAEALEAGAPAGKTGKVGA